MKKTIFLLLIGFVYIHCAAQTGAGVENKTNLKDSVTIVKDTINLRGIVYWPDGKPAKGIELVLQNEFHPDGSPSYTKTDTSGFFNLKGARPYDTVRVIDLRYVNFAYPNYGARFIVIYLPLPRVFEVSTPANPIEISARRKRTKKIPAFRVKISEPVWDGTCLGSILYPEFPGGIDKFISYIRENLIYPEKAIINNVEGMVQASFTISTDGSIINVKLIKGIGYGCDEQIIELIEKARKWKPGIMCGIPVTVEETVAVKIHLTDKQ